MRYSDLFITGCDATTSWMLPWFVETFRRFNPSANLIVYNFDGSDMGPLNVQDIRFLPATQRGWFNKPWAIYNAMSIAEQVIWLDTDCQVCEDLTPMFDMIEPGKLLMATDQPWTTRRLETWHNTGVVGVQGCEYSEIMYRWTADCMNTDQKDPNNGDQQVLHKILRQGLNRMMFVTELPRKYNTLRLDRLDGTAPPKAAVMHWTGQKGKSHIRTLMA